MQFFICGFSISKKWSFEHMQKTFKKRGFLVWSVVSTVWSSRENFFFFELFCAREIILFLKIEKPQMKKGISRKCASFKKNCALHKCNIFAVMHSKERHKNFLNHHYFHHPEVIFSVRLLFFHSRQSGNISLYLATLAFPTGDHQCKSCSPLKWLQFN